jgi:NADH:ubiquinone oxidoreductase subunit H
MYVLDLLIAKSYYISITYYSALSTTYSTTISGLFIFEALNSYYVSVYTFLVSSLGLLVYTSELLYALALDSMSSSIVDSLIVSIKFLILVALLVFIRGGIPRYRFDHLTKMGWIKFLSLVLASILIEMLLIWIF